MRLIKLFYQKNLRHRTRNYIFVLIVMLAALMTVNAAVMYINFGDNRLRYLHENTVREYDAVMKTSDSAVMNFIENSEHIAYHSIIGRSISLTSFDIGCSIFAPAEGYDAGTQSELGFMEVEIGESVLSTLAPYISGDVMTIPGFSDENDEDFRFKIAGFGEAKTLTRQWDIVVSAETMDTIENLYYGVKNCVAFTYADRSVLTRDALKTEYLEAFPEERSMPLTHYSIGHRGGLLFYSTIDSGDGFILFMSMFVAMAAVHFTVKLKRDSETDDIRVIFGIGISPIACLALYMLDLVLMWLIAYPIALLVMYAIFRIAVGESAVQDIENARFIVEFTLDLVKQTAVCGSAVLLPRLILDILKLFTPRSWELLKPAEIQIAAVYKGFVRSTSWLFVNSKRFLASFTLLLLRRELTAFSVISLFIALPLFLCSIYLNRDSGGFSGPEITLSVYTAGDETCEASLNEAYSRLASNPEIEELRIYRQIPQHGRYRLATDESYRFYVSKQARNSGNITDSGNGQVYVNITLRELNETNASAFEHIDAGSLEAVKEGGVLIVDNRYREPERHFDIGSKLRIMSSANDEGRFYEVKAIASHYTKQPSQFLILMSPETLEAFDTENLAVLTCEVHLKDGCDRSAVLERIKSTLDSSKIKTTDHWERHIIISGQSADTYDIAAIITVFDSAVLLFVTVLLWRMMKSRRRETYEILGKLGCDADVFKRLDLTLTAVVMGIGTLIYAAAYGFYRYNMFLLIYNGEYHDMKVYTPVIEIILLYTILCAAMFGIILFNRKEREVPNDNNDREAVQDI